MQLKKKKIKESDNQFKQKLGCNPWLRKKTFNNRMARVRWTYGLQFEYYVTWHQNYENKMEANCKIRLQIEANLNSIRIFTML